MAETRSRWPARRRIGVMLQVSQVPETLTVREHLTLFASYYGAPLPLKTLLDLAGIAEVADRRYGRLSGGQQQRVLFALAVCEDPLTDRERQVLRLAADGQSGADIAEALHLSEGTVRNYLSEAVGKLGGRNKVDAARIARAKGWL